MKFFIIIFSINIIQMKNERLIKKVNGNGRIMN